MSAEPYVPQGLSPELRKKILKELEELMKKQQSAPKLVQSKATSVMLSVYNELDQLAKLVIEMRKKRDRELKEWARKLHEQTEKEIKMLLRRYRS